MSASHAYAGVVFDLDGTLVDTTEDIANALNRAFAPLGVDALSNERVAALLGHGARQLVAAALEDAGLEAAEVDAQLVATTERYMTEYRADPVSRSRLFPGVVEALEALRRQSVPLAVCTNKGTEMANRVLAALGVAGEFAAILGADAVADPKPAAGHLLAALEELEVSPAQGLMIGDSAIDAAAAQAAEVDFLAVGWAPHDVVGARLNSYKELGDVVDSGSVTSKKDGR
jgi:phosphoglycolate phosphatase